MMKFKSFLERLKIGDSTQLGIIEDETDSQVKINGQWYARHIVKKGKAPKIKNRKRISPNYIVPTFDNTIDTIKLEKYINIMKSKMLGHPFPPISGFPDFIDESMIGSEFLNGKIINKNDIGKYVWRITDGHHRALAAIDANIPYLETKCDFAYIANETEYEC